MRLLKYILVLGLLAAVFPAAAMAAPSITLTTPTQNAQYTQNQQVLANYSCTGAVYCKGWQNGVNILNGQPIDTSGVGWHAFEVDAGASDGTTSSAYVEWQVVSQPSGDPGCPNGYVALSYDDGPTNQTTKYVNALTAGGGHATFFLLGNQMKKFPTAANTEVAAGNAIGDHTMDHKSYTGDSDGLGGLTDQQETNEIQGQASLAKSQTGVTETLFRPPYGDMNQHGFNLINSLGFTDVMWTADTNDWQNPASSTIVSRALAGAHNQAVVLMHDGHTNTLNAIPGILSGLKSRGLCPGKIVPDSSNPNNQYDYNGLPSNWRVVPWS